MECYPTEFASNSADDTFNLGKTLAGRLKPGLVIALRGGLGAGKTCLVKGIACGLGVMQTITSPTYTIISEYTGLLNNKSVPFYHIDAYRLQDDEDFESTGAMDCFDGKGITIIEWSERIPRSIPPGAVTITVEITGPKSRLFRLEGLT